MKRFLLIFFLAIGSQSGFSQIRILTKDASKHIGDSIIIDDAPSEVKEFEGGMLLINFGGKYPNQQLTVMIPAKSRSALKHTFKDYLNSANIVVSGRIVEHKGKLQMVVTQPEQITLNFLPDF